MWPPDLAEKPEKGQKRPPWISGLAALKLNLIQQTLGYTTFAGEPLGWRSLTISPSCTSQKTVG